MVHQLVGLKISKDICFPVPHLNSLTKGPFAIPKDTEVLIVMIACIGQGVHTGGSSNCHNFSTVGKAVDWSG